MENFGCLLYEWREEVQKEAAATPPHSRGVLLRHVPLRQAAGVPGRIGEQESQAALFDPNPNSKLSTSYGLGSWIQVGVPRSKLIMGLPLYGKTWKLKNCRVHGVGVGPGWNGKGVLTYAEVVEFNKANKAKVVYDEATVSMWVR